MSGFDALRAKLEAMGDAGEELARKLDRGAFVPCSWLCLVCVEDGTARPWRRPGETIEHAADRFTWETRGRCVPGCAFTATPAEESGSCG